MENDLTKTRRRLLRTMFSRSGKDEQWVDYIKRAPEDVEVFMHSMGYEDWVAGYRRQKWRFAGRAARAQDQRWTKRILHWKPFFRCVPWRHAGHPCARWDDKIVKLAGGYWMQIAQDEELWQVSELEFVKPKGRPQLGSSHDPLYLYLLLSGDTSRNH